MYYFLHPKHVFLYILKFNKLPEYWGKQQMLESRTKEDKNEKNYMHALDGAYDPGTGRMRLREHMAKLEKIQIVTTKGKVVKELNVTN